MKNENSDLINICGHCVDLHDTMYCFLNESNSVLHTQIFSFSCDINSKLLSPC